MITSLCRLSGLALMVLLAGLPAAWAQERDADQDALRRALELLDKLQPGGGDRDQPDRQEMIRRALEQLQRVQGERGKPAPASTTDRELDQLRRQLDQLRRELEMLEKGQPAKAPPRPAARPAAAEPEPDWQTKLRNAAAKLKELEPLLDAEQRQAVREAAEHLNRLGRGAAPEPKPARPAAKPAATEREELIRRLQELQKKTPQPAAPARPAPAAERERQEAFRVLRESLQNALRAVEPWAFILRPVGA